MGYRSEVVIVVPRKNKKTILNIIPEEEWDRVYDSSNDDYGNKEKTTLFYLSAVKWYSRTVSSTNEETILNGYDEVNKVMDYLEILDEVEGNSKYAFVRSGEDFNDVEELGDPYKYGIYINKSIDF
tara:strand:+ start:427 stop:804 length:378 start_codon:yes stop_codon:yes gene_type:complete